MVYTEKVNQMESSAIYISYVITEIFCIFFSIGIIIKANKMVERYI